jgi:hypothetical protein
VLKQSKIDSFSIQTTRHGSSGGSTDWPRQSVPLQDVRAARSASPGDTNPVAIGTIHWAVEMVPRWNQAKNKTQIEGWKSQTVPNFLLLNENHNGLIICGCRFKTLVKQIKMKIVVIVDDNQ